MSKTQLGQFMTTNSNYILQGLQLVLRKDDIVIEPFYGKGDLVNKYRKHKLECYDIAISDNTIRRDTLNDPPCYKNKYVITNPPYLARNKSKDKSIFNKYGMNDLYKCFLKELCGDNCCLGGILILPLNFWSSIRKSDVELRKSFLTLYTIVRVNVFENQVFDDTSYSVCSFQFFKLHSTTDSTTDSISQGNIPFVIFPEEKHMTMRLDEYNNYTIGGELYMPRKKSLYIVSRLLSGDIPNTNILVKCIDDKGKKNISIRIVEDEDRFVDDTQKKSARTFATLQITPTLSFQRQEELVIKFNSFLQEKRDKYNSLFMSNYREAGRKRISFDLVYNIVSTLLTEQN